VIALSASKETNMSHENFSITMDLSKLLDKYSGVLLDEEVLSSYEKFALQLFHDKEVVANPNLELTVQLDITDATRVYKDRIKDSPGATMTAYISWCLIQAMKRHDCFTFRRVGEKWYSFDNLPLFFPVAVGGMERFGDVLMEDVGKQTWPEFAGSYRENVDAILNKQKPYEPIPFNKWHIAHFIGNLPNIQFTQFRVHSSAINIGRPIFYFGKRYTSGDRTFTPMHIQFDHSNLDPYVVGLFLEDFEKILAG
jgi:chloramphenicol O-acetyltransferase type A